MRLPKSGSVVLIDDKFEEINPLAEYFSKEGVATYYYDGIDLMPSEPLSNVRLVFSDIKLYMAASDEKTICSTLIALIKKIISENNGPYLLILWSNHGQEYSTQIEKCIIDSENISKPIKIISLDKKDYFESEIIENPISEVLERLNGLDTGDAILNEEIIDVKKQILRSFPFKEKYRFRDDGLIHLKNRINDELTNFSSFAFLYRWENLVRTSANTTIKDFFGLDLLNENPNLSYILLLKKLALAYNNVSTDDCNSIIEGASHSLATILSETLMRLISDFSKEYEPFDSEDFELDVNEIESYIGENNYKIKFDGKKILIYKACQIIKKTKYNSFQNDINSINAEENEKQKYLELFNSYSKNIAELNTKLLFNIKNNKQVMPGNIYIDEDIMDYQYVWKDCIIEDSLRKYLEQHYIIKPADKLDIIDLYKHIDDEVIKGFVEISPDCDWAQKKWTLSRIVPFIFIPLELSSVFKDGNCDYLEISPLVVLNNKIGNYYFNIKCLSSLDLDYYKEKVSSVQLRKDYKNRLTELVSHHISRIGIMNL